MGESEIQFDDSIATSDFRCAPPQAKISSDIIIPNDIFYSNEVQSVISSELSDARRVHREVTPRCDSGLLVFWEPYEEEGEKHIIGDVHCPFCQFNYGGGAEVSRVRP